MASDRHRAPASGLPLDLGRGERLPNGLHKAYGTVLRRREGSSGGKSLELLLFLSGIGPIWASAPGAGGARSRFGAGTEPMVWSCFDLHQSPRRLYIKSCEVRADHLRARATGPRLLAALMWHKDAARLAPYMIPDDELLSLLGSAMDDLDSGVPPEPADVRFLWRWARVWGVAPSLERCPSCGRELVPLFTSEDMETAEPSALSPNGVLCPQCASDAGSRDLISRRAHMALYKAARVNVDRFRAEGVSIADMTIDGEWRRLSAWLRSLLS